MMENHIIAHTLELLGHVEYVINGPINSKESFSTGIKIISEESETTLNLTYDEFLVEYEKGLSSFNLKELRYVRDKLLSQTDWTQNIDVPDETKELWQPYRQALRDITNYYSSLDDVVWPKKPT